MPKEKHIFPGYQGGSESLECSSKLAEALQWMQWSVEHEKAEIARSLHDDLGGLIVGAIMDLGAVLRDPGHTSAVREKLERSIASLRAGIDLKRGLVERLRPSLLNHIGLFSALNWYLRSVCKDAGLAQVGSFPADEIDLSPEMRIATFRLVQEALDYFLSIDSACEVCVETHIDPDLRIGIQVQQSRPCFERQTAKAPPMTSITCRVARLGGTMKLLDTPRGEKIELKVPLPLARD